MANVDRVIVGGDALMEDIPLGRAGIVVVVEPMEVSKKECKKASVLASAVRGGTSVITGDILTIMMIAVETGSVDKRMGLPIVDSVISVT